jgi:hypothetical protein
MTIMGHYTQRSTSFACRNLISGLPFLGRLMLDPLLSRMVVSFPSPTI